MNYDVTAARALSQSCTGGLHTHAASTEIKQLEWVNAIERLKTSGDRVIYRFKRMIAIRGLSARLGAELAEAKRKGEMWADVMLANIRIQRESPSYEQASIGADPEGGML